MVPSRTTAAVARRLARAAQTVGKQPHPSMLRTAVTSLRISLQDSKFSVGEAACTSIRAFSTSRSTLAQPPATEGNSVLSQDRYNELANDTLDALLVSLEELQEEDENVDVEFSQSQCKQAGVLTLKLSQGTYVINKQPPNKQIWLSSPVSGPKRYDWNDRIEEWVYSRDGSTLKGLLKEEVGVSYVMEKP